MFGMLEYPGRSFTDTAALCLYNDDEPGENVLWQIIPELREKRWQLLSYAVTEVRKRRRKRLIFCQIFYRDATEREIKKADLIIKFYGKEKGDTAYRALQQLWQSDFKSPAQYQVPRPYGYACEPAILIQEKVAGREWRDLLLESQYELHRLTDQAATWLVRLQQSPIAVHMMATKANWEVTAATIKHQIEELTTSFPSAALRLENVKQQLLQQHRTSLEGFSLVPSHGDYNPGNILLTRTMASAVDFDAFGLRDAAFDVGYCIAQLLSMSYFRTGGDLALGAEAAARFWLTYEKQGGSASWLRVVRWVAASLLQILHYTLYAMKAERSEMLPGWLDMIEQWLSTGSPDIFESF